MQTRYEVRYDVYSFVFHQPIPFTRLVFAVSEAAAIEAVRRDNPLAENVTTAIPPTRQAVRS